jgi:hypothetical protein
MNAEARRAEERAYRDERFAAIQAKGAEWLKNHPIPTARRAGLNALEGAELSEVQLENHCITRGGSGRRGNSRCTQRASSSR